MDNNELFLGILKKYVIIFLAVGFGALAHALQEVNKSGWKGWVSLVSDVVVCSFVGYIFFQMALIVMPQYAIFSCSIGSYWGTKGFSFAREWFIMSMTSGIDKLRDEQKKDV